MKAYKLLAAALIVATTSVPAIADSIDFGQFGSEFTTLAGPLRGVTNDGVGFSLVGATDFTRYDEGSSWAGEFDHGQKLLYVGTGQMVFYFDHELSSLTGLAAQANLTGDYTAVAQAYIGGFNYLTSIYFGTNSLGPEGSIPHFSLNGPLDTLSVYTSNEGAGFAIGGVAGVPEPASWALMIGGFAMTGFALRRRTFVLNA